MNGLGWMGSVFPRVLRRDHLARFGTSATGACIFFTTWQDFMFATVFSAGQDKRTLPLGVIGYIRAYTVSWSQSRSASTALFIPLMTTFAVARKHFTARLTAGLVKG